MATEVAETKPMVSKKLTYADEETDPDAIAKGPPTATIDHQDDNRDNEVGKANKKSYEQMIIDTITENDPHRKGLSFVSIKKTIKGKYTIEGEISTYVKKAFEKLTSKEIVERVSGRTGMNGSIRFTKAYTEDVRKQQKLAAKPKPAAKKTQKTPKPQKPVKDKNNNEKKADNKVTGKVGQPAPHTKLNTKKTAITKTKLARSGGKVRLSIVTPDASIKSVAKAKLNAFKTTAGTKTGKKKDQKQGDAADATNRKLVRERTERKKL